MRFHVFRTARTKILGASLQQACRAKCLASKNLKNMGIFLLRNILTSFDKEGMKQELQSNQTEALNFLNASLTVINERRSAKNTEKEVKLQELVASLDRLEITQAEFDLQSKAFKPGKLFQLLDKRSDAKEAWCVLDDSVLDQMLRTRVNEQGEVPFQALPAKASEQVRKQISAEFKSWLASLSSFKADAAHHSGRPRMPGYMGKRDLNLVKYFSGSLGKTSLPTLADRTLFLDYDRLETLPLDAFEAYKDFDLSDSLEKLRLQLEPSKRASAKFVELRIIPKGRSGAEKFYLEAVFECLVTIADDCVLAKVKTKAEQEQITDSKLEAFYLKQVGAMQAGNVVAAADPGLNNLLALSFTNGDKSIIVSNARLERKIGCFDAKIDALKTSLATPRLRELQKKHDQLSEGQSVTTHRLSKSEFQELRTLQREVFNSPKIQEQMDQRRSWLKNALHTASSEVVSLLTQKGVQVLIMGKNKGWKSEVEMGRGTCG